MMKVGCCFAKKERERERKDGEKEREGKVRMKFLERTSEFSILDSRAKREVTFDPSLPEF